MEIFAIQEQPQKLGEVMSNGEILTMVQNALPKEWGSFTSSIDGKEEAIPLHEAPTSRAPTLSSKAPTLSL